jgi:hypothetical protein
MNVTRLWALRTCHLNPPGNIPGTNFCQRLSQPYGHMWLEELCQWKIWESQLVEALCYKHSASTNCTTVCPIKNNIYSNTLWTCENDLLTIYHLNLTISETLCLPHYSKQTKIQLVMATSIAFYTRVARIVALYEQTTMKVIFLLNQSMV